MSSTPVRPEQITLEWLNGVLRDRGLGAAAGFRATPLGQGRGFYGELVRLDLEAADPDRPPPRLVAKFAHPAAETRASVAAFGGYEREYRFYTELAEATPIATPRCHFAYFDATTQDTVLLLDFVDGVLSTDLEGATREQAFAAAREAGRLHRHWEGSAALNDLPWLVSVGDASVVAGLTAFTAEEIESALPRIEAFSVPFLVEHAHAAPAIIAAQLRRLAALPQTLVHIDYRIDNMIFAPGDDGLRMTLIDWQSLLRGPGAIDMATLTCYAMRAGDRAAWGDALTDAYLEACYGGTARPAWYDEAYARTALLLAFNVVRLACALDLEDPAGSRLIDTVAQRSAAAVEALGALSLV